jgi:MFS family permease
MRKTHEKFPKPYLQLWTAASASAFGDGIRAAALPLLAAAATSDPTSIGVVTAAGFLAWPLLGLVGGAMSDRFDRRALMWTVNAIRALVVLGIACFVLFSGPAPIWLLAALAFALGSAETVYDNAATGLLPQLVSKELLPKANSRLFTSQLSGTQLLGPPLGGLLFSVSAVVPLFANAFSFALSAALIAMLPRSGHISPMGKMDLRKDVAEGLRWLWNSPVLRSMALLTTSLSAVSGALLAMLVVFARTQLGLGGTGYGLLLGAFAVGSVLGSLLAPAVLHSVPRVTILIAAVAVTVVTFGGLASTSFFAIAAVLLAALGVAVSIWNITSVTLRQTIVPNELLGRVSSAYRTMALTFTTVGALLSGVLTSATSISTTLWVCSGVALLGLAVGLPDLLRSRPRT